MVERVESQGLTTFEGVVTNVELEQPTAADRNPQYKITIKTDVSKKSGFMYEWVGLTATTLNEKVPRGSNIDKYLQELEVAMPAAKSEATIDAALKLMIKHKFKFVRKVLGKSFNNQPAKEFWVPHTLIE